MKASKNSKDFLHFVQVVDTSQLVKNEQDIFSTSKVACMLKQDQLHNMIGSSSTKNILSRILYEKTRLRPDMAKERELLKSDHCLAERSPKLLSLFSSDNFFFVGERNMFHIFLTAFSLVDGFFNKLWIAEKIYEYNLVIYYNADKPTIGRT